MQKLTEYQELAAEHINAAGQVKHYDKLCELHSNLAIMWLALGDIMKEVNNV